jgi:putative transposase
MPGKSRYVRHLPHQVPEGSPIFLTWNLKGAMPRAAVEQLRLERERLERQPPRPKETGAHRKIREGKLLFAAADRFLDRAVDGPMHLKDPAAAKIAEDIIVSAAGERYDLFAWCVMSNHAHVLLTPRCELKDVTQWLKGFTAHQINGLQEARGRVFWQDESYDHWIRDEEEMMRVINYIEENPVKAGLCERAAEWPWSSARLRGGWLRGEPFAKEHRGWS